MLPHQDHCPNAADPRNECCDCDPVGRRLAAQPGAQRRRWTDSLTEEQRRALAKQEAFLRSGRERRIPTVFGDL